MNAIELSGWLNGAEVALPADEELYLSELNKRRAVSRKKSVSENYVADTSGTYGSGKK